MLTDFGSCLFYDRLMLHVFLAAQALLILTVGVVAGLILMIGCFSLCCYKKLKRRVPKTYSAGRTDRNNSFPEQVPMMNTSIASSDLED